jgi:hypothetical protein
MERPRMPSEQTNAGFASDRPAETSLVDGDARGDLDSVPAWAPASLFAT